ncbi:I78 family peptidase inhibitor [Pseudomonas sp. LS1212]|uniref:I78 family peptidase inhibitor n=1 Tax=Pseudomonas sp. LS1212 TaxID=2972478 RepID=UPI00215C71CA|nr:I78 family peptidase inhibitor [Pseudomonas sp. LS1212]UVJ45694.1 I78 family peptidase inhibitor [Pseudomonas sp. LS1212]
MSRMRASLGAVLAAIVLAGCSSSGSTSKAPEVAASNSDGRCQAGAADFAIGKQASPALLEQARTRAGAQTARILKPHDMVTLEYRSDRLNLNADDRGAIIRVNCG